MASLRRVQKACDQYGLCIVRRPLSYRWAVFRPLTPDTITFVDIRDITDGDIERVVMSWALADLFNTPSL
jgi:hypothetical protein